jgi:hypothetical protein
MAPTRLEKMGRENDERGVKVDMHAKDPDKRITREIMDEYIVAQRYGLRFPSVKGVINAYYKRKDEIREAEIEANPIKRAERDAARDPAYRESRYEFDALMERIESSKYELRMRSHNREACLVAFDQYIKDFKRMEDSFCNIRYPEVLEFTHRVSDYSHMESLQEDSAWFNEAAAKLGRPERIVDGKLRATR